MCSTWNKKAAQWRLEMKRSRGVNDGSPTREIGAAFVFASGASLLKEAMPEGLYRGSPRSGGRNLADSTLTPMIFKERKGTPVLFL